MKPEPIDRRDLMIPSIVVGLLIWGGLLAMGAYVFQGRYDYRKPLIIMACVGLFIGFWTVMIWRHRGRFDRQGRTRDED